MSLGRRDFLSVLLAAAAPQLAAPPVRGGRFVRNVPLGRFDGRPSPQLDTLLGKGLDARQFTDLSALTPGTLTISNDRFFVRTAASAVHAQMAPASWRLRIGGRVRRELELPFDALAAQARPIGTHLMECSGNADPANFGLMSAAAWTGVPIGTVLDRVQPQAGRSRVCVTGVDDEATPSKSSIPGASWIFSREDLERTGAFLATQMNGTALPPDHGHPVRLVVPNWYGCACIKWVSRVDFVGDDEPATPHMREFAARTHQQGEPHLAREFTAPQIELAAMPIRVEQWRLDNRIAYRVIGLRWGGTKPSCALTIRFKYSEAFVPVDNCPAPSASAVTTWSLWTHTWHPDSPGRYQIVLAASDPTVPARRLDLRYYTREAQIDEV